jgi:hypothetical protein
LGGFERTVRKERTDSIPEFSPAWRQWVAGNEHEAGVEDAIKTSFCDSSEGRMNRKNESVENQVREKLKPAKTG